MGTMAKMTRLTGVTPPTPGAAIRTALDGHPVAIFNAGGTFYAVDATCTHAGGPLERGRVEGTTVTCPWHGSQFNLQSGAVVRGPAATPVRTYSVRLDGDALVVEER